MLRSLRIIWKCSFSALLHWISIIEPVILRCILYSNQCTTGQGPYRVFNWDFELYIFLSASKYSSENFITLSCILLSNQCTMELFQEKYKFHSLKGKGVLRFSLFLRVKLKGKYIFGLIFWLYPEWWLPINFVIVRCAVVAISQYNIKGIATYCLFHLWQNLNWVKTLQKIKVAGKLK